MIEMLSEVAIVLFRLTPSGRTIVGRNRSPAIVNQVSPHAVAVTTAVVIAAETISVIDVTAVAMLRELAADFRRDGTELVLARDIGSVRDLLRLGPDGETIRTYPTVRSAIAAIGAGEAAAPEV